MPRLFLPSFPEQGQPLTLAGHDARYVLTVLRMRRGDELTLIDPSGGVHRARIQRAGEGAVYLEVMESRAPRPEPPGGVVLVQGVLKGGKMDLVVQKATELGVKEIVPVVTERTQVRETRKAGRWQKIAREAARQCGRTAIPGVREPVKLAEFLDALSKPAPGMVFWEEGGKPLFRADMPPPEQDFLALVGPEGGLTSEEVIMAEERGLTRATLGPLVLRAETAALAAVTLLQFLRGRMGEEDGFQA